MVSGFVLSWVDLFLPCNHPLNQHLPQGGTCNLYQSHHSHLLFFVILSCSQIFKDPPMPENHSLCYGIQSCHTGDPLSFSRPTQASKPYLLTVLKPTATLSSLLSAFAPTQSISSSAAPQSGFLGESCSSTKDESFLGDWILILKRCSFEKLQEYLPFQTRIEIPAWPLTSLGKLQNLRTSVSTQVCFKAYRIMNFQGQAYSR